MKEELPVVVAFDFDGTLTNSDTLLHFIRFNKGTLRTIAGFLRYLPQLVMMKLGAYPNYKAKQKVFAHFFKGMTIEEFNNRCDTFAIENRQRLLRPQMTEKINRAVIEGKQVVVISASIENWVRPFFDLPEIMVIGTQIEVVDGKLTGQFTTANCYGQEKVNRLLQLLPHRSDYRLIAFGDSRGDRELLAFADESHYRDFL